MTAADEEIDKVRSAVARHFSVYGVIVSPLALTFQVAPATGSQDDAFDGLRRELAEGPYVPSLTRERGELLVHVQRKPAQRFTTVRVNLVMLAITVVTTVIAGGAYNWSVYTQQSIWSAESFGYGTLFFSLPLLAILGFHEMGHYVVAKRHGVRASLPFFLPSIPPLGTFGAFISMRDPLPDRKALLDVGASGPLVGFAIAVPVTIAGLFLTAGSPHAVSAAQAAIGYPQNSAFYWFLKLFIPVPDTVALHPLAFAGWVGLFVTGINLLPAGQLDGGHIARALLGNRQHYLSWAAVLALVAMSYVFYTGWILFAFLILFLGVRHPPPLNDLSRLNPTRTIVGVAAVAILLATFIPQPFLLATAQHSIAFEDVSGRPLSQLDASSAMGVPVAISFYVNLTTPTPDRVGLTIDPRNLNNFGFNLSFQQIRLVNGTESHAGLSATIVFNESERAAVDVLVDVPTGIPSGRAWLFGVTAQVSGSGDTASLAISLTVT